MRNSRLLGLGVIGTAVAALCCFTPILVVGASIVGFSAIVGWLDFVLFPALAFFVALTFFAVNRRHKATQSAERLQ